MAVVLPHGVLFRGAAEGVIRKYLIEETYDAGKKKKYNGKAILKSQP